MPKINFRCVECPEIRKADEGRKLTFVASDGTRDTAGTVLNPDGWDLARFNRNGIIGYQHKVYGGWDDTQNPDNVIGKGFAYTEDGKLMVDIEFEPAEINELAEKIYQKLLFGSLKAVSVGFLPLGRGSWGNGEEALDGSNPTYYYAGQELLEVSVVNIPANPNALRKSLEAQEQEIEDLRAEAAAPEAPIDEPEDPDFIEPVEEAPAEAEEAAAALEAEMKALDVRARLSIAGAALL